MCKQDEDVRDVMMGIVFGLLVWVQFEIALLWLLMTQPDWVVKGDRAPQLHCHLLELIDLSMIVIMIRSSESGTTMVWKFGGGFQQILI